MYEYVCVVFEYVRMDTSTRTHMFVCMCVCVCVCVCHNEKKCQTNGKHK